MKLFKLFQYTNFRWGVSALNLLKENEVYRCGELNSPEKGQMHYFSGVILSGLILSGLRPPGGVEISVKFIRSMMARQQKNKSSCVREECSPFVVAENF